jgi:hypothetical protein
MAIRELICGLIAAAYLSTASQPVTIRMIGGTVFLLGRDHGSSSIVISGKCANWSSLVRNTSQPNSIGAAALKAGHREVRVLYSDEKEVPHARDIYRSG